MNKHYKTLNDFTVSTLQNHVLDTKLNALKLFFSNSYQCNRYKFSIFGTLLFQGHHQQIDT